MLLHLHGVENLEISYFTSYNTWHDLALPFPSNFNVCLSVCVIWRHLAALSWQDFVVALCYPWYSILWKCEAINIAGWLCIKVTLGWSIVSHCTFFMWWHTDMWCNIWWRMLISPGPIVVSFHFFFFTSQTIFLFHFILQPKKRGRRKGSRNKLSPEITKKIGDANLHYAHGRYEDVCVALLNIFSSSNSI